jgi:hypothetical protein
VLYAIITNYFFFMQNKFEKNTQIGYPLYEIKMDNRGKKRQIKRGLVHFSPGQPMQLQPEEDVSITNLSKDQQTWVKVLGNSIRAYIDAALELLNGKYKNIKDQAPQHLAKPSSVLAIYCKDGIVIRYDVRENDKEAEKRPPLFVGCSDETISQLAPKISESVVYCHPNNDFKSVVPQYGPEILLTKTSASTGKQDVIFRAKIGFNAVIQTPSTPTKPPVKPQPIVSVRNSFELNLFGEMLSGEYGTGKGRPFIIRDKIRLPVGWDCIEVFPSADKSKWKAEYAKIWAENDLLASVVAAQFREQQFRNLDPNATARMELAKLLNEYKRLLDSSPGREEILQTFLKDNPVLLCPAYIKMKPKLQIGNKVTDFVFQEATGDYVLVELEPSTFPMFIKSGDTSSQLNHARNQILDWRRYIEDNLHTIQGELDLPGISANPRGLVVIGRSHMLSEKNRRKLTSVENESPKTKIMTYDDVFDNAKAIVENLLGPLWLGAGTTEVYYLPS